MTKISGMGDLKPINQLFSPYKEKVEKEQNNEPSKTNEDIRKGSLQTWESFVKGVNIHLS